ncbi:Galactose mutarotase-like protein [Dioscorea alata]|uniref:Galactose mutarotase-like protein n=1 Tax=Dioscorea alata TaxID=55571 RepID=A0ACB7TYQ6_DIOAL|nr:Galactose mutarotase-like protein [Dioscorea alata]
MASLLSLHLPRPSPHHLIRASASSSSSSSPTTTTTTTSTTTQASPQSLEEEFGRKGIKFTDIGGVPTVELTVRNGSSLSLRIPDGLITSYKPKVYWKEDGFEELLYTIPTGLDSGCPFKGGLSLVLHDVSKDGSPWQPSQWTVKDSDSDSIDAVQVELSSSNANGSLEIRYVITLSLLCMATAVIVKNQGTNTVKLKSAMLSHLRFKSRRGSAIQGLRGCSYCSHPPLSSVFGILSPAEAMKKEPPNWSLFNTDNDNGNKEGSWLVEDNLYTVLGEKLSRVYTAPPMERLKRVYNTPPSKFETIDQRSGLGFRVIRIGYEDFYICSPGALSEKYGKDYFICTGAASMLVPVDLDPGEEWRGAQVIEHDNL